MIIIYNNTNTTINSCISAGVNYSWVNGLKPNEYYCHEGPVWATLNVNFWLGEASEFRNSGAEIGVWVAGIFVAVIGVVLIPFTEGASAVMSAEVIAALVAGTSAAALTIAGVALAVKDFANEPAKVAGIPVWENRIYMAEGSLAVTRTVEVEGRQYAEIDTVNPIHLRELTRGEFDALCARDIQRRLHPVSADDARSVSARPVYEEESTEDHMKYYFSTRDAADAQLHHFKQHGVAFYAFSRPVAKSGSDEGTVEVWAEEYKDGSRPFYHFSTRSREEAEEYGYRRAALLFHAYKREVRGSVPVYLEQFCDNDAIYYLSTRTEEEAKKANFKRLGVAFFALPTNEPPPRPVVPT